MEELPEELLQEVLCRLLSVSHRAHASLVCRRFYDIERKQRHFLKVGCGLHPLHPALTSLLGRFSELSRLEVEYAGWMPKFGKQLDDDGVRVIATMCPRLLELSLSFCVFVTDVGLGNLAACQALRALRLNFSTGVTGRGLLSLVAGCKNLLLLHLTRCIHVNSVEWLTFLARHGKLQDLAIRHCRGIGEGDLAKLQSGWNRIRRLEFEVDPNYRYLKLHGHWSVDRWRNVEVRCHALKDLNLTNCLRYSGRGLACIFPNCPSLERLHLNICVGVRDMDLIDLAKTSTRLKSFSLRIPSEIPTPQLTDDSLKALAIHCQCLEKVSIAFTDTEGSCFSLTGIVALVEGCSSLKVLVLDSVNSFNDNGMKALCASRSLETLKLIKCQDVSDEGVQQLMNSPCLKHVNFCRCSGVTDLGFVPFTNYPKFESINIEDCPRISEKGIQGTAKVLCYSCDLCSLRI